MVRVSNPVSGSMVRPRAHQSTPKKRILTQLQAEADSKGLITWDVSEGSTVARAHQHATGAEEGDLQRDKPGGVEDEPADHG
ncbi:hypothetical protein [Kitasatospora sp. NBC_01266]|uniref:hypothetical protein n=1 Tax=Kitasatospora sp. NBC_01266 TaxID=2903572 RepID=UPI002E33BB57|nr:hypothetical protein [Kitasatospora sp. NBC_01266]